MGTDRMVQFVSIQIFAGNTIFISPADAITLASDCAAW